MAIRKILLSSIKIIFLYLACELENNVDESAATHNIIIQHPEREDIKLKLINKNTMNEDRLSELYLILLKGLNDDKEMNDWENCERILPEIFKIKDKFVNYEIGFIISLSLICNSQILQVYTSFLPETGKKFQFIVPPEITLSILQILSTLSLQSDCRYFITKNYNILTNVLNCLGIEEEDYIIYYEQNNSRSIYLYIYYFK